MKMHGDLSVTLSLVPDCQIHVRHKEDAHI